MAPKPWNPNPRYASNTPEALEYLPVHDPWVHRPRRPERVRAPQPVQSVSLSELSSVPEEIVS